MSPMQGNDSLLLDLVKDLSREMKDLTAKAGKLDVLDDRTARLSSTVDNLMDLFQDLPDTYLSKDEYERKGNTDKIAAVTKELADFKVQFEKELRELTKEAGNESKSTAKEINAVYVGVMAVIISLLSTGLFFALQHAFPH